MNIENNKLYIVTIKNKEFLARVSTKITKDGIRLFIANDTVSYMGMATIDESHPTHNLYFLELADKSDSYDVLVEKITRKSATILRRYGLDPKKMESDDEADAFLELIFDGFKQPVSWKRVS